MLNANNKINSINNKINWLISLSKGGEKCYHIFSCLRQRLCIQSNSPEKKHDSNYMEFEFTYSEDKIEVSILTTNSFGLPLSLSSSK